VHGAENIVSFFMVSDGTFPNYTTHGALPAYHVSSPSTMHGAIFVAGLVDPDYLQLPLWVHVIWWYFL